MGGWRAAAAAGRAAAVRRAAEGGRAEEGVSSHPSPLIVLPWHVDLLLYNPSWIERNTVLVAHLGIRAHGFGFGAAHRTLLRRPRAKAEETITAEFMNIL